MSTNALGIDGTDTIEGPHGGGRTHPTAAHPAAPPPTHAAAHTTPAHHQPAPAPARPAPRTPRTAAWNLAPGTRTVARARTLTRHALTDWHIGDPADTDDIVLMVDELLTNAVVHGTGPLTLRLRLDATAAGTVLTAEITDGDPTAPGPPGPGPALLDWSEDGRGLLLVHALATDFGTRPEPAGKTVWFTRRLTTP
ncbi:ATP-binding protein [Actinomadura parmotrematis]|uniref:ATP-binding protein n=1 Tax=Actinomadura parmotrematis TaxID=2864039 RepID=A0ABS7FR17_9ACTN|nr:ATP-binding protein [Actinomadura parmotrematis]MBW8482756.1 ATP-binding protein [Actinomadura parmotrematis]